MKPGDVMLDFNRRSCIVTRVGHKRVYFVLMEPGELVETWDGYEEFEREFTLLPGYPVKRAIRVYLKHSGGVSAKAKAALKALKEVS